VKAMDTKRGEGEREFGYFSNMVDWMSAAKVVRSKAHRVLRGGGGRKGRFGALYRTSVKRAKFI